MIVFRKFSLSLKNYENFGANELIEVPLNKLSGIGEVILFFFKAHNLRIASLFKDCVTKKKGKRTTCLPACLSGRQVGGSKRSSYLIRIPKSKYSGPTKKRAFQTHLTCRFSFTLITKAGIASEAKAFTQVMD